MLLATFDHEVIFEYLTNKKPQHQLTVNRRTWCWGFYSLNYKITGERLIL